MQRTYILHGTLFGWWFPLTLQRSSLLQKLHLFSSNCTPQISRVFGWYCFLTTSWHAHITGPFAFLFFLFQFCYVASSAMIPKRFSINLMACLWKCVQTVRNWGKTICTKTNNFVEISWNFLWNYFFAKKFCRFVFIRERTLWQDIPF
jgi:hypothetical protein